MACVMGVVEQIYATRLTSRQRDLLLILLEAKRPLSRAELAEKLNLSSRQLNYDLKWVGEHLAQNKAELCVLPRIGIEVRCTAEQRRGFMRHIGGVGSVQIVLSSTQRFHLLIFILLIAKQPLTLEDLQQKVLVSRTTIIKDLNRCESWLGSHGVLLERRPNFGIQCKLNERLKRHVMLDMLWEGSEQHDPLIRITHFQGLQLVLANDRDLLPVVNEVFAQISKWDIGQSLSWVSETEKDLGGRFSDDAVLYLALALAIQADRVRFGQWVQIDAETLMWLKSSGVWPISTRVVAQFSSSFAKVPDEEVAWVCMYLLSAPRSEGWFHEVDALGNEAGMVDEIMQFIADTYGIQRMSRDRMLREGLINHLAPACFRQRFGLNMQPLLPQVQLSEDYEYEVTTAKKIVALVYERSGNILPERESSGLAQLMRAAYMRERQDEAQQVIVVCPSGMVTAQLLVARLKVYFPRLGSYRVVSLRELGTETLQLDQLIVATVPLPAQLVKQARVVQVHPLLLPTDIERITREIT